MNRKLQSIMKYENTTSNKNQAKNIWYIIESKVFLKYLKEGCSGIPNAYLIYIGILLLDVSRMKLASVSTIRGKAHSL